MKNLWSDHTLEQVLEDDNLFIKKLEEFHKCLITKEIDISNLVECLGTYLTSTNTENRLLSTKFLSKLLISLPVDFLNETQINFLTNFYCDRLKDHHSILPNVLIGLLAISEMKNLNGDNCKIICLGLLTNVPFQNQLREDRENIFKLLKNISEKHEEDLIKMGDEFIYCMINAISGERDPRNLNFLFNYMPIFFKKFPLYHLADEMFEIFECYFPVDFHPSPTDPAAITRDNLAISLSKCLCGNIEFFDKCIELFYEKIDSELVVAKMDSLQLLIDASKSFPIEKLEKEFDKIWNILRTEILQGSKSEISNKSINAIISILNAADNNKLITENILQNLYSTLMKNISDINERLFESSMDMILKISNGTSNKFCVVSIYNKCIPPLLQQINIDNMKTIEKIEILELITKLIIIIIKNDVKELVDQTISLEIQNKYIELLNKSTENDYELIQKSFDCIEKITEIFSKDNRLIIYKNINKFLLLDCKSTSIENFGCIFQFSKNYPEEVNDTIIKNLIQTDLTKTIIADNSYVIYEIICSLISLEYFQKISIDYVIEEFLSKNNLIILKIFEETLMVNKDNEDLLNILNKNYNIIDRFIEYIKKDDNKLNNDELMRISNIIKIVICSMKSQEQIHIIKKNLSNLNIKNEHDLYIVFGLIGQIPQDLINEINLDSLLNDLMQISLKSNDDEVKKISHILLCSLINKISDGNENHQNILKKIISYVRNEIEKHNKKAVELLSWITKGLLVSGHKDAAEIVEDLTNLLDHPVLSNVAALTFEILSVEFPQLHLSVIKILFKQKLFHIVLNKLMKKTEEWGENHLIAFSYVLKITPHKVIRMNLNKIGLILLKCLMTNSNETILISLSIIGNLIKDKEDFIKDHLQFLIENFLKLSQYKNSMKIRIKSINLLKGLIEYPVVDLIKCKDDVIYGLIPALDDHKRLVRNAAVETRAMWFVLG